MSLDALIASRERLANWASRSWRADARLALGVLVLALTMMLAVPAIARAATVSVPPEVLQHRTVIAFAALPGETNDVLVTWLPDPGSPRSVLITDASAPLTAGRQCQSVDLHSVRCDPTLSPSVYLIHVDVQLGDRGDRVRATEPSPAVGPVYGGILFADGGVGDDVLDARGASQARLDGGGGRDQFHGAFVGSVLTDGDRDGAAGDLGPGPDVINGGPGDDTLSYRERTAPVIVDFDDNRAEGERGEGDVVRAVESADGGAGDDTLAGDEHRNRLYGGPGRDVLTGRAGNDFFGDVSGSWIGQPALTDPAVAAAGVAGDAVSCGRGRDEVQGRRPSDFTPVGCEHVVVKRASSRDPMVLPAYPSFDPPYLNYSFHCRTNESRRPQCLGTIVLRRASGSVLAEGRVTSGKRAPTARLLLTPLGRVLAGRAHGVLARIEFHGRNLPFTGWTIRLKTPA